MNGCICGADVGQKHTMECAIKSAFAKHEPDPTASLLAERGKTHGDFRDHAKVTQDLKNYFYAGTKNRLSDVQREAVDMILHKLGRIAAGDPNFKDHWDDIAGYAKLVSQDLERGK